MRLIVHGQQAFGKAVLERLLERGEDVVAVYCAPDKGERIDPLKQAATDAGLPVLQPASFKASEVADEMLEFKADLCIMAYVILMVPSSVLNIPRLGSIQYHPSLLPDHKGPSSINWPIIQGKKKTGLTIFWPDDGLDTGPILLQKEVDILPDDTLGSLYFDKLFPMGVDAIIEAYELVKEDRAPKIPQDPNAGSYESWCGKEQVQIDWSQSVNTVYNLIRGANPQPGAWTTKDGAMVQIFDCQKIQSKNGNFGQITTVSDSAIHVAAKDGEIAVKRVRAESGKVSAIEFAQAHGLGVGDQLGT